MDASDRKARLAAIRRNRQKGKGDGPTENTTNVPIAASPVVTSPTATSPITTSSHPHPTLNDSVTESRLEESDRKEVPKLQLSELSNETIETVSLKVQNNILNNAQQLARDVHFEQAHNQTKQVSYTKDLEDDLQNLLGRAQVDTDRAINNILQSKYEIEQK